MPAGIPTHELKSLAIGQRRIAGTIVLDSSSDTTSSGPGWSCTHTGTGTYTIALTAPYVSLDCCMFHMNDGGLSYAEFNADNVAAASPGVDFETYAYVTPGTPANCGASTIFFELSLCDTSVR